MTCSQNSVLQALIEASSAGSNTPTYKFVVNSTIIQQAGATDGVSNGRRGMHSAIGSYWNTEKDGTWSYKWEGAEKKGMDVVVVVTWIGL